MAASHVKLPPTDTLHSLPHPALAPSCTRPFFLPPYLCARATTQQPAFRQQRRLPLIRKPPPAVAYVLIRFQFTQRIARGSAIIQRHPYPGIESGGAAVLGLAGHGHTFPTEWCSTNLL